MQGIPRLAVLQHPLMLGEVPEVLHQALHLPARHAKFRDGLGPPGVQPGAHREGLAPRGELHAAVAPHGPVGEPQRPRQVVRGAVGPGQRPVRLGVQDVAREGHRAEEGAERWRARQGLPRVAVGLRSLQGSLLGVLRAAREGVRQHERPHGRAVDGSVAQRPAQQLERVKGLLGPAALGAGGHQHGQAGPVGREARRPHRPQDVQHSFRVVVAHGRAAEGSEWPGGGQDPVGGHRREGLPHRRPPLLPAPRPLRGGARRGRGREGALPSRDTAGRAPLDRREPQQARVQGRAVDALLLRLLRHRLRHPGVL